MAERKEPPSYEPGRGGPKSQDDAPGKPRADQGLPGNDRQPPGQSGSAPGHNKPQPKQSSGEATGQSQKSQIAQFYRSQGRQPDDVIHEVGGMKLTLRDLDG